MPFIAVDPFDRFASAFEVEEDGCWRWSRALDPEGYGSFFLGRRMLAHRAAYELLVGTIPDGLHVDHLCHGWDEACPGGPTCTHRACVNPEHLEPVTPAINAARAVGMGRYKSTLIRCPQGHPYDEANTYITPEGWRQCKTCRRSADARHRGKRKASV